MTIINRDTQGNGLDSGFSGFGQRATGSNVEIESLLQLAEMQGGKVSEIARELGGGKRSMLSSIGKGIKDTFNTFIEVMSVPGQVVAGMISPDFTIEEAIKENKRVSDVLFGDTNIFDSTGQPTTMQKIGDAIVRLPVDILTDPLTYLTFGAGSARGVLGKMGFKSNVKVSLQKGAASQIGKVIDDGDTIARALSDQGDDLFRYAKQIENAVLSGDEAAVRAAKLTKQELLDNPVKALNKEVLDFVEANTEKLVKETLQAKFSPDAAKKVMSDLLEKQPALVNEFIDKGGVKFFGKTLLEGERLGRTIKMIPGMKKLDAATEPFRSSVQAMFDPAMTKVDNKFIRIPEEFVQNRQKLQSLVTSTSLDYVKKFDDLQKTLNLSKEEVALLTDNIANKTLPSSTKLRRAYYQLNDIKEEMIRPLSEAGIPVSMMDNWVGLIAVPNDTRRMVGNSNFAKKIGAAQQAQNIKAIPITSPEQLQKLPSVNTVLKTLQDKPQFAGLADNITKAETIEDITTAIGQARDDAVKSLTNAGESLESALKSADVKELEKLQDLTKTIKTEGTLIGVKETAKLQGISDELLATLGDDVDAINYLMDNEQNIYKRVATTAQELEAHGITGFDQNLLTAWTTRGLQNIRQGLSNQFAKDLARFYGRWADEASESWVPMSNAVVNDEAKELAKAFVRDDGVEMVFHPAVAKAFDEMINGLGKGDDATEGFLRAYDRLQSYYKSYLTTMFPMFHGRNAFSNVLQNFLDVGYHAVNPQRHFMAADMIMKNRKYNQLMRASLGSGDDAVKAADDLAELINTKIFTDRTGKEWTFGMIQSVAKENSIAFNPNLTGAMDVRTDPEKLASFYHKTRKGRIKESLNLLDADTFAPTRLGRDVGQTIEEHSRLINFVSNLIDTGDVGHAAQRTNMFLFDYQNGLTKFEKSVMRRIMPFYSFTRFNLELQMKTLFSAPGKLATEVKGINSLGSILGGEPMTPEEKKLLPPWLSNSINLKRKKKGGTYEVITGFGTPIEQPFQALSKSGLLGALSPLIKLPIENATGYNMFRGEMTTNVIDAKVFRDAPKPIKDFIGYVEYEGTRKDGTKYTAHVSLNPQRMQNLLSTPYSRVMPTLSKITDKDISGGLRALYTFTGLRAETFDEARLIERQNREKMAEMEKLLRDVGIRGQFTRGYTREGTTIIEQ